MAVVDTIARTEDQSVLSLESGPRWDSFEQFRAGGSKGLRTQVGEGQIGRLSVKGDEFVIMRAGAFNRLYGAAQDVSRLSRGLQVVRQAVQLVLHTSSSRIAVEHLRDLIDLLPNLKSEPAAVPDELYFDSDEQADEEGDAATVEIDPARVRRPQFGQA